MRRIGSMLLVVLGLLFATSLSAQQPLMSQFKPDLRVYPQFFTLAQGRDGDLYVGGNDGVLRYDGGRWHFLALPRPGAVRALAADADGRLWTGATDSFGYIERDATGEERYVDLSAQFADDLKGRRFADIWRVLVVGDEVWFEALHDVFVVSRDGRRRGFWHHGVRGRRSAESNMAVGGCVAIGIVKDRGIRRQQRGGGRGTQLARQLDIEQASVPVAILSQRTPNIEGFQSESSGHALERNLHQVVRINAEIRIDDPSLRQTARRRPVGIKLNVVWNPA